MKSFLLILSLLLAFCSFAQERQSAVWHFGYRYRLDFNAATPEVTYYLQAAGSNVNFGPWASICDRFGNYEFSAHNNKIFDKDGNIMKGGERLHPAPIFQSIGSATEYWTPLIVERPSRIYWVFWYQNNTCTPGSLVDTACPGFPNGSINRAIVDMKKQNGYGEVIVQKELIDTFSARHLAVMVHQNNRDAWLVTHGAMDDQFRSYLINDTGLVRTPVISRVRPRYDAFRSNLRRFTGMPQHGVMISSPNSAKLCACPTGQNMEDDTSCYLFDFNRANGLVSYTQRLKQVASMNAHTFSVDSKKLYFIEGTGSPWPNPRGIGMQVWQFNLDLSDTGSIQQSRFSLGRFYSDLANTGMLAMDGRVYLGSWAGPGNGQGYLGRIEYPNSLGNSSNLNPTWYLAPSQQYGGSYGLGFPVLNQSLLRNAYKIQAIASKDTCCLGDTIKVYGYGAEADRFRWSPNPFLLEDNLGTVRAVPTQNTSFTVKGWSRSDSGTATTSVMVVPKPLTPSITWNGSDSLHVVNPVAGTRYLWYRNDTLIRTTDLPRIKADSGYVYKVRSVGIGCNSDASNLVVTSLAGVVPMHALIKYAPNPVRDHVQIQVTHQQPVQVMLYSTQGQLLYKAEHAAGSTTTIPMAHLPSGLYRLRVQSGAFSAVAGLVRE